MNIAIESKREQIKNLCARLRVKRLELFGSATRNDLSHPPSDIDFLVEFKDMDYVAHADAYFGLKEELEALFQCEVDLVETKAIKNPYFLKSVNQSRALMYASC